MPPIPAPTFTSPHPILRDCPQFTTMAPPIGGLASAGATLGAKWAATGGFGPLIDDWLIAPREPQGSSPDQETLRRSSWARWQRGAAPSECSFDSASLAGNIAGEGEELRTHAYFCVGS